MKNSLLALLASLFLCMGCDETDDTINPNEGIEEETNAPEYLKTIDFSSSVSEVLTIEDFDVEAGYLYFIYGVSIYRIDISTETNTLEFIVEDEEDWPETLKVIGTSLYYQGVPVWSAEDIKQINLDYISEGVQCTYPINGSSRSQLYKNNGKLYYVSSVNSISPINNFYEFNPSSTDSLILTDEYIIPKNMRVVDHYLYFSSKKEVRRFDLNNSTEASSIVYTVSDTINRNYIKGFDILDNVIYYTLTYNTNIYYIDLEGDEEQPSTFKTEEESYKYGKLIISEGKLYVRKVNEKQIEVWNLNEKIEL